MGWDRGDTAASTHAAWRGRPHASHALEWEGCGDRGVDGNVDACGLEGGDDRMRRTREREGRDTIWLNGLFRDFAVYNVLAGKVAIG